MFKDSQGYELGWYIIKSSELPLRLQRRFDHGHIQLKVLTCCLFFSFKL